MTRAALRAGAQSATRAQKAAPKKSASAPVSGDWLLGVAVGAGVMRRYRLYRPRDIGFGERLPLMVMLHGCLQDADGFAASTRMNALAARERFLVLYPEQDRLSNANGCWNWFDTRSGRAQAEAALVLQAVDQVCLLHGADRQRVAVAGLSAGASLAALLATRHPTRLQAVVMHSGVAPGTAHSTLTAVGAMGGRRATQQPTLATTGASGSAAPWPPLLVIQGGADGVVAPRNGRAAALLWAAATGALPGAERGVQRGQRYPMQVTDFRRGNQIAATLIEVPRLAHAWSGGRAKLPFSDPQGPDASLMAWRFAERQFAGLISAGEPR
ncbi:MAG: PHB depolymerase family esterase [Rubrivivax sp.]